MKNAFFTLLLVIFGAILAGCGGGGGASTFAPSISAPTTPTIETYIPDSDSVVRMAELRDFQNYFNSENNISVVLTFSPNAIPSTTLITLPDGRVENAGIVADEDGNQFRDTIISGARAGDRYRVRKNSVWYENDFVVFEQNRTLFLAILCSPVSKCDFEYFNEDGMTVSIGLAERAFTYQSDGDYRVTNVFFFNRGLVENAHSFGGFHINAEDKHVEYRWTPFSDLFIDSGYRKFDNAAVHYAKMQMDYNNFYLQYSVGGVRSDYYKNGKIDGMAFGWQKNGFAIKTEKPLGNDDKAWLRLFYKTEL